MIVRDAPKPWELLFILRGSIVPVILPQLSFVVLLSAVVTWLDVSHHLSVQAISPLPFSLIGIALSIFAGFRNSASYERWWEGRRLLGQLVIECRNLSRGAVYYLPGPAGRELAELVTLFAQTFKTHLRDEAPPEPALPWFDAVARGAMTGSRNVPDHLLQVMSQRISRALHSAELSPPIAQMMEERVISLSAVLAGAERIKLTPLPFAYSLLLHRTAYLFCCLLPFGLAETTGAWTPVLCAILAYTFFGLDALGDELAVPFGRGQNALPMSAIVRAIEINIGELLGQTPLPPPLVPRDHVLI